MDINLSKTPIAIPKQILPLSKTEWATFTYFGPEMRIRTKLFRITNIKIAFKTNTIIQRHLRPSEKTEDIYNLSGVYKMNREEWPLKYIEQT
jgi:hypothetical protein